MKLFPNCSVQFDKHWILRSMWDFTNTFTFFIYSVCYTICKKLRMDWIHLMNSIPRRWTVTRKIVKENTVHIHTNSASYILVNIAMLLKVNLKNWLSNKESIQDVTPGKPSICESCIVYLNTINYCYLFQVKNEYELNETYC